VSEYQGVKEVVSGRGEVKSAKCPRCERPMSDWGTQWRCTSCNANFPK
jgi:tRNA(Ile2) C34 agmatinyltransferase TiaS